MFVDRILPLCVAALLTGCGTYVPGIQEPPGDAADEQALINSIVHNVKCELRDSFAAVYAAHPRTVLDNWGVQMSLNFTMGENSAANPNAIWFPPGAATSIFSLAGGANLSSDATRINKVGAFYTVRELRELKECEPGERPGGWMLMQSDLKLRDWLFDNLSLSSSGLINFRRYKPDGTGVNVLSHEVKFEIVTKGNITPSWKLARVTVNPSGSLLSASRTRTHDLILTLGPTVIVPPPPGRPQLVSTVVPARAAAEAHLSSEIGLAVSNGIRNARLQ